MGLKICQARDCSNTHTRRLYCCEKCRQREWERRAKRSQAGRVKKRKDEPVSNWEERKAAIIKRYGAKHD